MTDTAEILKNSPLFRGIGAPELKALFHCLRAKTAVFEKGETILSAEETKDTFGLVVSGNVRIFQYDFFGNGSLITTIGPSHIFGEAFSYVGMESPMTAEAAEKSEILFLKARAISSPCEKCCGFHTRLINNLLRLISLKNIRLTQKIECMAKRTTREKILTYLNLESMEAKNAEFEIPLDRQGLADYLGVDRSAMSAELGRLKKEGLIECRKNKFKLLHPRLK